jgi:hydroxymethylglutaryl-CoA reductase
MNGVDAVAVALGQDWRAIEAAAHSYASITGRYMPLTKYRVSKDG